MMNRRFQFGLLICLSCCFISPPLHAFQRLGPFPVRTQNPLYLLFLGMRPDRPVTLAKGKYEMRFDSSYSNLFEYRSSSVTGNVLDLDMEILRLSTMARYGVTDDFEIGIEVPKLWFWGGVLDPVVQGYHNTFGFPNAGRETVSSNRFAYRVALNGATLYEVDAASFGISDLVLDAKYRFLEEAGEIPAMAVQAMFKAPTGDRDSGMGSGRPDGGLFWLVEQGWIPNEARCCGLVGTANLGLLFLGGAAPLEPILHPLAFGWMVALEVNFADPISAIVELNGTTNTFHGTGFTHLDDGTLDLTLGVKGGGKRWFWQVAFTEDPGANDPSVDFTGFMSLGYRPARP